MPYSEGFTNFLRGRAHGMKARDPELAKISEGKAKAMLAEAGRLDAGALKRAVRRGRRRRGRR